MPLPPISSTATLSTSKYDDWLTNEIMTYVRDAPLDDDAVHNLKLIMERYEKRKSFSEKLKALFK